MVTRKDIESEVNGYLFALGENGFPWDKAYLFGSYVKGDSNEYSDIDLAVWSEIFDEDYFKIIEKTAFLRRVFKNIELHPFILKDTRDNNPFIGEIEDTGILIKPDYLFDFTQIDLLREKQNALSQ